MTVSDSVSDITGYTHGRTVYCLECAPIVFTPQQLDGYWPVDEWDSTVGVIDRHISHGCHNVCDRCGASIPVDE